MRRLAALAGIALLFASPAALSQQQSLSGLSQSDRAQGAEGYKQIVSQFGGKVDGPLAEYVRTVGLRVAMVSVPGSRPQDWTITVLNSPVPNAMATPGGYLYITRGLLAMINTEAELASVLGHEAGHVAGRHSAKRQGRAMAGALATLGAAIFGGSNAAQIVNYGSTALVSGYSRGQEDDADTRGLRYLVQAGYDPRAAASMLQALERVSEVEGKAAIERSGVASIFSSHPVTADRIRRVAQQAAKLPAGGKVGRDPYLGAISGMTFGDATDQGIVNGPTFRHAGLNFGFDAPPGFRLQNSPQAVVGQGPGGARFQFQGVPARPGQPLEPVVSQVWSQLTQGQRPQVNYDETRLNGFDAAVSTTRLSSNGRPMDVGVTAIRGDGNQIFVILTQAPGGSGGQFDGLLRSFRKLTPQELATAGKGRRLEVVTVKQGDTVRALLGRMAPPYNREASFLALNGIGNRPLVPGERLKLIIG